MSKKVENILAYLASALMAGAAAAGGYILLQTATGKEVDTALLLWIFGGSVLAAIGAMPRPKVGREELSSQVDAVGTDNARGVLRLAEYVGPERAREVLRAEAHARTAATPEPRP